MATKAKDTAPIRTPDVNAEIRDNGTLQLAFASGNTIEVDPAKLSEPIRAQALLHGLKQKLVDAAAIARDTATGKSATPADKEAAVMEVYNRITAPDGTWNKVREAGATAIGGLLVAALMQLTGKDKPAILAFLEGKSNEEKAALRKNQKVAEIILQLQAANVNPDIDTDALLGELVGEAEGETEGAGDGSMESQQAAEFSQAEAEAEADEHQQTGRKGHGRKSQPRGNEAH